jgi:hypothetical protein
MTDLMDALFELTVPVFEDFDGQLCTECRLWKPFASFQIERARSQGDRGFFYKHRCKKCCSKLSRTQRVLSKEYGPRLYYEQDGRCAHCGNREVPGGRRLGLDHCHHTGKVRGLLDAQCNTSIGKLGLDCPPDQLDYRLGKLGLYLRGGFDPDV